MPVERPSELRALMKVWWWRLFQQKWDDAVAETRMLRSFVLAEDASEGKRSTAMRAHLAKGVLFDIYRSF